MCVTEHSAACGSAIRLLSTPPPPRSDIQAIDLQLHHRPLLAVLKLFTQKTLWRSCSTQFAAVAYLRASLHNYPPLKCIPRGIDFG